MFRLPMTNRRFLRWFDDRMGILTTGVSMKRTAAELAENNRKTGFSPDAKRRTTTMYTPSGRERIPFFEDLRRRWYPDGSKRFPADFALTPTLAKF
ncbi:hypothetical protein BRD02_05375 [Halobacteriales archaeon QS_8_69_73]|nr:MAG: hypothetical protein BRD02_05375 [Halobacteriales archaeon QS_8_69_73]